MNLSLKLNYHLGTTFALGGAALIWFLGIGGRDLYLLPLLCWLPFAGWRIWKDKTVFIITWPSQRLINRAFSYGKWALGIFFLLFCLRSRCCVVDIIISTYLYYDLEQHTQLHRFQFQRQQQQ